VRKLTAAHPDVRVIGRVPKKDVLSYIANFDLALYPRTLDQGVQAVKTADYLAAGVPLVSYNYEVTKHVAEQGAGVLVETPTGFVDAVVFLAENEHYRRALAKAAASAGKLLDWNKLALRYEADILERYLRVI